MANSDYVFEQGDPVTVGTHGQTNYVYASGEPVTNQGRSEVVFETGVGLGGGTTGLIFQYDDGDGGDSDMSGAVSDLEAGSGLDFRVTGDGSTTLDSAIQETDFVVVVNVRHGSSSVSSAEYQAWSDHWDGGGQAMLWGEDGGGSGGSQEGRRALSNDFVDEAIGVRPFTEDDPTPGRDTQCTSDASLVPEGNHPVYSGISSSFYFVNSHEALVVDPPDPAEAINDRATGYVDIDGHRMWLDGSYVRYSAETPNELGGSYPHCGATSEHVHNIGEWIVNAR